MYQFVERASKTHSFQRACKLMLSNKKREINSKEVVVLERQK